MFETTIREAFDIDDSSSEDEEEKKQMYTKEEMLKQCLEVYEEKNPIKVGRVAGPSQRRINKLDCTEQSKIISKCNQIEVAQREDGMMKDDKSIEGNVLDQMLKKYSQHGYYRSMFKQIIKEVKNSETGADQCSNISLNDFYRRDSSPLN